MEAEPWEQVFLVSDLSDEDNNTHEEKETWTV